MHGLFAVDRRPGALAAAAVATLAEGAALAINALPGLDDAHDLGDLGLRANSTRVELVAQDVVVADSRAPALLDSVDQLLIDADQGLLGLLREAREGHGLLHGLRLELVQGQLLLRCERADVLGELGELGELLIHCGDASADPVGAAVHLISLLNPSLIKTGMSLECVDMVDD